MRSKRSESGKTFSFRLPEPYSGTVLERASVTGRTPSAVLRELVLDSLQDGRLIELSRSIEEHRTELRSLRADLATTLEVILLNLTEAERENIRGFIEKALRPPTS